MITPQEKKTIIKVLGKQYSRKIKPFLATNGENHTVKVIQNVVNGITENTTIEMLIIKLVAKEKISIQKLKNMKKSKL